MYRSCSKCRYLLQGVYESRKGSFFPPETALIFAMDCLVFIAKGAEL